MRHWTRGILALLVCASLAGGLIAQEKTGQKKTKDGRFTITHETSRQGVLSQGNTGTCWSFGTISYLEAEIERIIGESVDLSEMHVVYGAYLEKGEKLVKTKGKSRFSQGGLCHDVIEGIRKYGIVPASAYSGLCEGDRGHSHGEMERVLKTFAQGLAKRGRMSKKAGAAYRAILDTYIGTPPETVAVGEKLMTPKQYADEVLKLEYDKYVEVMSYASSPFWSHAKLDVPDNWMGWDQYLNVPAKDMMDAFDHALMNGYSTAVDMDVSEPGFVAMKGIADLTDEQKKMPVDDLRRMGDFAAERTTDDHLMHVVGIAKDGDGQTWYLTKNSWGKMGPYQGYLFMSRPFVELKMLSFMVHADGLPKGFMDKIHK